MENQFPADAQTPPVSQWVVPQDGSRAERRGASEESNTRGPRRMVSESSLRAKEKTMRSKNGMRDSSNWRKR
jgi:hypothetical protein